MRERCSAGERAWGWHTPGMPVTTRAGRIRGSDLPGALAGERDRGSASEIRRYAGQSPRKALAYGSGLSCGVYYITHWTPTVVSHRINIVVNDDIWGFLKTIPQGERSRTINQALREWIRRRRRIDATAEMDRLRNDAKATAVTSDEIVRWIRAERERGH